MTNLKFSVCIPNYNYGAFIGKTIQSVLGQTYQNFEILIADNASTDNSVEVIRGFSDSRIKLHVNAANMGFSFNLDRAARMAMGDVMIMLSSDDLMKPKALEVYADIFQKEGLGCAVTSTMEQIDQNDAVLSLIGPNRELLRKEDEIKPEYASLKGMPIYQVPGQALLKRCLLSLQNPFNFAATAYPKSLYDKMEGYRAHQLINPDKWFHYRLLAEGVKFIFVDMPLFQYRWHSGNQTALQQSSGALKYLIDEYVLTFQLDQKCLEAAEVTREELEISFVKNDILKHGLATLARGDRGKAERIYNFGKAVYPKHVRQPLAWIFKTLLSLGSLGVAIARYSCSFFRHKGEA